MPGKYAVAEHPQGYLLSRIDDGPFDFQSFFCGDGKTACPEINYFIKTRALKEHVRRMSTTYILHESGSPEILVYITTTMGTIRFEGDDGKEQWAGALHVANLGRNRSASGKKLGGWLVEWAILEAEDLSARIGCRGVSLYCYEDMLEYYRSKGFEQYASAKKDDDNGEDRFPMLWDLAKALNVSTSIGSDYAADRRWKMGLD